MQETPTGRQRFGGGNDRPVLRAIRLGFRQRCPSCGQGPLFQKFLKVREICANCAEALHHQRADDAPPYFTIMIVGHIIVPAALLVEQNFAPSTALHMALWLPMTMLLTLWFLPRIKGSLVGVQWAKRMHGFGATAES